MTTAVAEPPVKADAGWDAARKRKLAHAHVLAAAIYRDLVKDGFSISGPMVETKSFLPDFQRSLILQAAEKLGFPVESRRELTPVQLAQICERLREQMRERGIPIPRKGRKGKQSLGEKIQVILDKAGQLGWTQQTLDAFVERQARNAPIDTHEKADAVLAGLNGILRHRDTEAQRKD